MQSEHAFRPNGARNVVEGAAISTSLPRLVHCLALLLMTGDMMNWRLRTHAG